MQDHPPELVFDGHLDLAMNALRLERDLAQPVAELRRREVDCDDGRGLATVSLPSLKAGGVRLCLATVIARAKPWVDPARRPSRQDLDWPNPVMAHAAAAGELAWYELMHRQGQLQVIRTAEELEAHATAADPNPSLGVILTMEGADPIVEPDDLEWWHSRGLRTLMLAHFGKSGHAHGTPSSDPDNPHDIDGPLTDFGRSLLKEMDRLGMPLDLSHLSDQSFAECVDRFAGPIYASHSSCRAIMPGSQKLSPMRMLSDSQIRSILDRDGVVGLPLYNAFLQPGRASSDPSSRMTLAEGVIPHVQHICDLTGNTQHVAIGSDFDGGFGAEHIPAELGTAADLPKLGQALVDAGFTTGDVVAIMRDNWLRMMKRGLPVEQ